MKKYWAGLKETASSILNQDVTNNIFGPDCLKKYSGEGFNHGVCG